MKADEGSGYKGGKPREAMDPLEVAGVKGPDKAVI